MYYDKHQRIHVTEIRLYLFYFHYVTMPSIVGF